MTQMSRLRQRQKNRRPERVLKRASSHRHIFSSPVLMMTFFVEQDKKKKKGIGSFFGRSAAIMMSENARLVFLTFETCEWKWRKPWLFTNIFILITGVLTNVALLWLLLREKKSSSASQVGAQCSHHPLRYYNVIPQMGCRARLKVNVSQCHSVTEGTPFLHGQP